MNESDRVTINDCALSSDILVCISTTDNVCRIEIRSQIDRIEDGEMAAVYDIVRLGPSTGSNTNEKNR